MANQKSGDAGPEGALTESLRAEVLKKGRELLQANVQATVAALVCPDHGQPVGTNVRLLWGDDDLNGTLACDPCCERGRALVDEALRK